MMKRRDFVTRCLLGGSGAVLAIQGVARGAEQEKEQKMTREKTDASWFRTRGLYFHDGFAVEPKEQAPLYWGEAEWRREIAWLKANGVNAVEFATMLEFNRVPSTAMEKQKIAGRQRILRLAHELGIKFGYILTNTVMSTVPADEEPGDQLKDRAVTLCPREPGNFEKTVSLQEWYMDTYKESDFFEEFAADWGGCTCGKCTVSDYLRYVRAFAEKLAVMNPKAKLYANTWCIGYWGKDPLANGWKSMFEREIACAREVIDALPSMPPNVHLALPCHHLYRPLTFTENGGKSKTTVFPTRDDIARVNAAGREVLAWPHFVMDDDAYRPAAWGLVHSEVRYVRDLLRSLRDAGIRDVMCNLYLPYLQLSNTYAYGRLLDDPDTDPSAIIQDFAKEAAVADDADKLRDVLVWLENHSYWQEQVPDDGRLPNLPCSLNRAQALALLKEVRPNPSPKLPWPVTPANWLSDLRGSIPKMDWTD